MQRNWLRDNTGAVMPLMAVSIIALVGMTGAAVDTGRAQLVQSKLSSALDAAGLAAGSNISTEDVQGEVEKYFDANFPSDFLGAEVTELIATPSDDNTRINLSAEAEVPVRIMQVMGFDTLTVRATSEITRETKGLEVVIVLDTTGSMDDPAGSTTKLQAAKDAANDLVDILFGDGDVPDDLYVGIVPFAQAVNIGSSRTSWVTGTFNWGPTSWGGCVDARETSNRDVTDDPPSTALFPRYYWPCDSNNQWYGTNSNRTNCSTGSGMAYKTPLSTSTRGPNLYCSQAVTPMTSNETTLHNAINSLSADGNTHVVLGAAWAWRMISPRWRNLWGGEMDTNALPLDYDTPLMNKAVIIMTDGDNTISNSTRGAYWYLSNGKLGTTNSTTAVSRLNSRTETVCTNMKNNGIFVYTIAFGTAISGTAQTMLRNCATNGDYYFYSPTGDDLEDAFHTIGDSLSNLRISH